MIPWTVGGQMQREEGRNKEKVAFVRWKQVENRRPPCSSEMLKMKSWGKERPWLILIYIYIFMLLVAFGTYICMYMYMHLRGQLHISQVGLQYISAKMSFSSVLREAS